MNNISLVEIFIALFIGMGPIKVLLVYIASTEGMEKDMRRKVAQRTVLVAGAVGLALFLIGAILQAMLHFSIGALTIFGGLILLILALNMVMGGSKPSPEGDTEQDPMSLAISPLAIPLTLNPVGIVILMTASVQVQDLGLGVVIILMILIIMGIDLVVLYGSDRVALEGLGDIFPAFRPAFRERVWIAAMFEVGLVEKDEDVLCLGSV